MLDHGTGIVIGETAAIGDNCSLLQGVTLGGTGKETGDRHPKIGDNVMIGAGAKVLGNIKVGNCSRIASGSVVLKEVPPRDDGCRRAGQGGRARRLPRARPHHGSAAAARRLRLRRLERRPPWNRKSMVRVQAYLRKVFGAKTLSVRARPKIKDSAEVYVGEDFVGTLTRRQRGRRALLPVPDGDPRDGPRGRVRPSRGRVRPNQRLRTLTSGAVELLPSAGSSDIQICTLR